MSSALSPRKSGSYIAQMSQDVSIKMEGVKQCARHIYDALKVSGYGLQSWRKHQLHPKTKDKAAIDWVFVVDSLNFCFWPQVPNNAFEINYGGKRWTGYWSLCAAVNRALEAGVPVTDPKYYSCMSLDQLAHVFQGESNNEVPLLEERLRVLHEVGQVLMKKYDGSFSKCIEHCDGSAKDLLQLIVTNFPAFRDEADYKGKQVSFYKRAQILIADVWGCCEGKGLGRFHDIDEITMFADYRVPQVLVYFGAMKYSKELLDVLEKDKCLENGDCLEVEIRGCSIWTIELVCAEMKKLKAADVDNFNVQINPIIIDEFLWDYRQAHAAEVDKIPYHKVRSIFY